PFPAQDAAGAVGAGGAVALDGRPPHLSHVARAARDGSRRRRSGAGQTRSRQPGERGLFSSELTFEFWVRRRLVNSNSAVRAQATARLMMCPCCGAGIAVGVTACACGGRFVGAPLAKAPVKIRRYGPAVTALLLLVLAVALTALLTKWLAPLALVPAWLARRALRLEKRDPAGFGGRRVAAATLGLALAGAAGMAAYGISHIPRALENHRVRRVAATEAAMHHVAA